MVGGNKHVLTVNHQPVIQILLVVLVLVNVLFPISLLYHLNHAVLLGICNLNVIQVVLVRPLPLQPRPVK